jgi:hypothetical protein
MDACLEVQARDAMKRAAAQESFSSCNTDESASQPCPADPVSGEVELCRNVAHSAFASDPAQIARWMPAVLEVLARHSAR